MNQFRFRPASGMDMRSAVVNLIIINVIFFIAKFFAASKGIDLDNLLGLFHPMSPNFHWWQVVTCMFMHANFRHLLFNMIGLYFFGRMLENVWGTKRFIIFYMVCGLGATVIYLLWETYNAFHALNMNGEGWALMQKYADNFDRVGENIPMFPLLFVPMVGASGAIFGLIAGAALLFPNTTIYLYFSIPVKLKWFALIYGSIELWSGYSNVQADHTAHFAHLGGMIFGFILVKIYQRSRNTFY